MRGWPEPAPVVVDGVMYMVQPPNDVIALDAVTGRMFWMYSYNPSIQARPCCGRVNRGLAILGDTLYMGTIDGHLIAIDAKSGKPVWDVAVVATTGSCGRSPSCFQPSTRTFFTSRPTLCGKRRRVATH